MFPPFRRVAVVLTCLVFIGTILLGDQPQFVMALAAAPTDLLAGRGWWTPLTAAFVEPGGGITSMLLVLALQWSMASRLEDFWGAGRLLAFSLCLAAGSYASLALWAMVWPEAFAEVGVLGGALPINAGVCLAFAVVFARTEFRPFGDNALPGRFIGGGLFVLVVLASCVGSDQGSAWGLRWGPLALLPATLMICAGFLFQPWRRGAARRTGKHTTAAQRVEQASHLRLLN